MPFDPLLGALIANSRRDVAAHAAMMRSAYRDSFLNGHGCSLCERIDIPAKVSPEDRQRRADSLWRAHWRRMASRRWRQRRRTKRAA